MLLIRHLVLLCLCAVCGAAFALLLPLWLPAAGNIGALLAGLGIFLTLGLLVEAVSRTATVSRHESLIDSLVANQSELEDEITWTRREVKAVREALEAAAHSGRLAKGPKAVDEIMQEVSLLKDQMLRLSSFALETRAAYPVQPHEPAPTIPSMPSPEPRDGPRDERRDGPRDEPLDEPLPAPVPDVSEDLTHEPAPERDVAPLRATPDERPPLSQGMALVRKVRNAARESRSKLSEEGVLDEVRAALKEDRIEFVLQPIVSLPQRKHRAYECYSRLNTRDGAQLLPELYIEVAEEAGLIAAIDNILLLRCIQLVRRVQQREREFKFFCNLSSHTLNDESFFGDLVDFLEANVELAPKLVFEFTQNDFENHGAGEIKRLRRLANLGCGLSIDRIEFLDLDAEDLAARHVRFVKLEAALLLDRLGEETDEDLGAIDRLKADLTKHRIDMIVEKVEGEPELVELLDYGIDYGQGYLFGEPRPARVAA